MGVKIGVCDWALPGGGLYAVRIASELGLSGIALQIGLLERNYPLAEPDMQRYYLEDQQKYCIDFLAIALNDFDNISIFSARGTRDYETVRTIMDKAISTALALDIPVIQVPGFAKSEIRNEQDMELTAKALQYLCDRGAEHGLVIGSENLLTPSGFKDLASIVDRKNFKAYYDSQNYCLFKGYDQLEILEGIYDHMAPQLHVKDGNDVLSGALLGQGNSNFHGTIGMLKQKGYDGYLIIENYYDRIPLRLCGQNPFALIRQDIELLKAVLA